MKTREPISVCITTKNVDDTIRGCLESIDGWADEIVILDCQSTDDTLDICEEYTQNIYQHDFSGFADLFSTAISHATNEWVLLLDADEEVPSDLRQEIDKKLQQRSNEVAFSIPYRNRMFGGWVRTKVRKPALARKDVVTFEKDYIHPKHSVKTDYEDQVGKIKTPIDHYTYSSVSDYLSKFDQYTSLEALRYYENQQSYSFIRACSKGAAVAFYMLFVNRGILDGKRGLFFALWSFMYEISSQMKIREIKQYREEHPENWKGLWLDEECQRD